MFLKTMSIKKTAKFEAMRILQMITSVEFIASLFLIDRVYYNLAIMKKKMLRLKHFGL